MDCFLAKCATSNIYGKEIKFGELDASKLFLKESCRRSKGQTHVNLTGVFRDTGIHAALLLNN